MINLETERLYICEANICDIEQILKIENDEDNKYYTWVSTYEEHVDDINNPNTTLLCVYTKDNNMIGYVILDYHKNANSLELRRVALIDKKKGYGTELFNEIFRYCFVDKNYNKIWLDVYHDNVRAIGLYEKLKMHKDGVLRENYIEERGYIDQIVYSLLKREYEGD